MYLYDTVQEQYTDAPVNSKTQKFLDNSHYSAMVDHRGNIIFKRKPLFKEEEKDGMITITSGVYGEVRREWAEHISPMAEGAYKKAQTSYRGAVWLSGQKPGTGKSTLARQLIQFAHERRRIVSFEPETYSDIKKIRDFVNFIRKDGDDAYIIIFLDDSYSETFQNQPFFKQILQDESLDRVSIIYTMNGNPVSLNSAEALGRPGRSIIAKSFLEIPKEVYVSVINKFLSRFSDGIPVSQYIIDEMADECYVKKLALSDVTHNIIRQNIKITTVDVNYDELNVFKKDLKKKANMGKTISDMSGESI